MNLFFQLSRIAVHNLRRGGQRAVVALLCIMFGVMSLVAMLLLSQSISRMLVLAPEEIIGADISLDRGTEDYILPAQIQELTNLQKSGVLKKVSLAAYTSSLVFHVPGSSELHFLMAGIGIDPAGYPPIGKLTVGEPANIGMASLLQNTGDVLVTNDLAIEYGLKVGDELFLSDLHVGPSVDGHIRGIINDTPNHQGSKIYYNHATAQLLANSPRFLNTALAAAPNPTAATAALKNLGWRSFQANELADRERSVQEMFELALNGAGILGLLVGGIGIANTMQVLLRRRRGEVAVWKTLGYRSSELQLLFALEAGMLGLTGSLIGAGLGVALSRGLVNLFSRTSTLLVSWSFSPLPVLTGILVGTITAVIFAMFAIVTTSRSQPMALLRNEPMAADQISWLQNAGLVICLALAFTTLTSLIMGSWLKGIGVLLAALVGLIALGGMMSVLTWLATRLLWFEGLPFLKIAKNNLNRRGLGMIFAMVALFIGVVSLALGALVTENAQQAMQQRTVQLKGPNLTILAPAGAEAAIRQAITAQNLGRSWIGYQTSVQAIRVQGITDGSGIAPVLVGRENLADLPEYSLQGAAWGSEPDGVYTFQMQTIPIGSTVDVTLWDGSQHPFKVVGSYMVDFQGTNLHPDLGLLLPVTTSLKIAKADTVQFFIEAPAAQAAQAAASLGVALPQATVVNLVAYAARFTQAYHNLFIFAVAMAGLALLAGVLLIANSVSLAVLDRRYQIGVLKAMGYTRWHVLITLVVEYSLLAVIASAAGLGSVVLLTWVLSKANNMAATLLVMPAMTAIWIGLVCVGLTLATVIAVTWKPTQVSPLVVLNERGSA